MDLQKQLFMKKLAKAEQESPGSQYSMYSSEAQDELMPLRPPSPPVHTIRTPERSTTGTHKKLPQWSDFFEHEDMYSVGEGVEFRVYYTLPSSDDAPVFVLHHGAGSSALSFALLAKTLVEEFKNDQEGKKAVCGVMSFDCRGHGETVVPERLVDYRLETLVNDAVLVINQFREKCQVQKNPVFLIGHSLGGAVLTSVTYRLIGDHRVDVKGLGMFDIVEDTAVHSLQGMHTYLSNLPRSFDTEQEAIDWHLKTGLLRNSESAEVSVPSYLQKMANGRFSWRIDLSDTCEYWNTWFVGLSKAFVNAPTSKLLILAGTDSLDKELMIGQMQGKYQLVVFQDSGHFIQEDVPRKTALTLVDFWKRNDKKVVVIKSTWGMKTNP